MRRRRFRLADTDAALHHTGALKEQFDDLEQQHEASSLGMWIFLATEVMFFGGLFTAYTVFRNLYYPDFVAGSHLLEVQFGATNTAVLICSSLTMALAVRAAQTGKRTALMVYLICTIALGIAFMGIKFNFEWYHDYVEGFVPGIHFAPSPERLAEWARLNVSPRHVEMFMYFYFVMTGVHALHMVVGVGLLTVLTVMAYQDKFGPDRFNAVEMSGLYWHFVDIIWIFLFPLLYLLGGRF
jgi:cytochrome c oxidase subunit III